MILWLPIAIVVAVAMDVWAGLLHGRFWHRWLYPIHASHHEPRKGRFEKNDWLALLHAPIAIALILWGSGPGPAKNVALGIGIGMTAFAVGYVVVHDGLVHGRLPVSFLLEYKAFRSIVRAHQVHHRTGGVPYVFFFGVRAIRRHRSSTARRRTPTATLLRSRDPKSPVPTRPDDDRPSSGETERAREVSSRL